MKRSRHSRVPSSLLMVLALRFGVVGGETDPVTTRSQHTEMRPWLLPFLAALVAALAAILLGTTASASATVEAETRVGAFDIAGEVLVGPPQHESPGQRLGEAAPQLRIVVATGVAANDGGWLASRLAMRNERGAVSWGRGGQKLSPDPAADGFAHSTFRRGPDGTITHYAEWTPNARSPRGYDIAKRYDGVGGSHFDKGTGTRVPTPHVQGPWGVRPAYPWEIPQ